MLSAQSADSTGRSKNKTGWTFGVLPSVAFDADLGFQYGALTNIYYFGDGSTYPEYLHSIYAEAAYTTKNYGLFRLSYDSKYLIPKHRLSVDLTYLPDALCDFYGYNGYESMYHPEWTLSDDDAYVSRAFYKMQRDLFRFSADLQGKISGNWNWNVGLGILDYRLGSVNIDRLNKNQKEDRMLPDTTTLYDYYVHTGRIRANEAEGGLHPYIHGGITYDSRDRLQNPHRGIHADAFLTYTAAFGDMKEYNNLKFNAAWRHYISIVPEKLILAYRLGTQLTLAGESPFYVNTYMNQLYMQRVIYEGLGGSSSCRGIMRNRILSDGFAYANIELRIQLFHFTVGKENFYIGINPFVDEGMVIQPIERETFFFPHINDSRDLEIAAKTYNPENETYLPHLAGGCGLKIAMNENFVLSVDWARAFKEQDNSKKSNLYIKMGYLF